MKLCKDCKWCKRGVLDMVLFLGSYSYARCMRPGEPSPVDGSTGRGSSWRYCATERMIGGSDCGPEGQFWGPK